MLVLSEMDVLKKGNVPTKKKERKRENERARFLCVCLCVCPFTFPIFNILHYSFSIISISIHPSIYSSSSFLFFYMEIQIVHRHPLAFILSLSFVVSFLLQRAVMSYHFGEKEGSYLLPSREVTISKMSKLKSRTEKLRTATVKL